MRRMLCLALILLLSLCACSSDDRTEQEIEYKGNLYTVNMEDGTITSGGQVYRYEQSPGSGTFTYPDGSTCWWSQRDDGELWGCSDDYDPEAGGYVDGYTLLDVLEAAEPQGTGDTNGGQLLAGLLFLAIGAFNAVSPIRVWELSHGWRFKNAEPSDAVLAVYRIVGIAACVIGALLVLLAFRPV